MTLTVNNRNMRNFLLFAASIALFISTSCSRTEQLQYDVCVYGGTSAGVISAYTAAREGKTVVLIEPGFRLGGLSSGGLGRTDIGNKQAIQGLSHDFYRRVGKYYGALESWIFEPKVAEKVFQEYITEGNIPVLYGHRIVKASRKGTEITSITLESVEDGVPCKRISAKMFIDCTYEGDLMARAGVSYVVGREDNSVYGEYWDGVSESIWHQFPDGVDPYVEKGNPASGLLWGISSDNSTVDAEGRFIKGMGNKMVQAYNFRICMTTDPDNFIPIEKPADYDASRYELLVRTIEAQPNYPLSDYFIISPMPNNKTDINNRGGFSTDMIGMNWDYPEGSYEERERIFEAHKSYTLGLLWFWQNDPRVPAYLQEEIKKYGLPKDEYVDTDHWTPSLYVREARRMTGEYVATQADCEGKTVVEDYVGWAAYGMDSHNCQRVVVERNGVKMVKNEGDVEIGVPGPYPISYRSITPKREECTNLLVPVCVSASHIAFGSIRMEPVFMVLGQSAAKAASLAIDAGCKVQEVDYRDILRMYEEDPFLDGKVPEIRVDDPDAVLPEGDAWVRVKSNGGFGPSFLLFNEKASGRHTVSFPINVKVDGKYELYTFYHNGNLDISVRTDEGLEKVNILKENLELGGDQSSGTWLSLGKFDFKAGSKVSVEFTGGNSKGRTVADAVLAIPVE